MKVEFDPWVQPPPGFVRFDRNGFLAVAATLLNQQLDSVVSLQASYKGWLVAAGILISDFSGGANFAITVGGVPVRDYAKVTVPLGAPETPAPLHIPLEAGQTLALVGNNPSGVQVTFRWRLYGWFYPSRGLGA